MRPTFIAITMTTLQEIERGDSRMKQGDIPSLVEELRGLLAKASPQPWAFKPQEHDDWGMIRTTVANEDGWFPVVARACDVIYHTSDDYSEHRRNKTDPTEDNAALIVAAVNALPALLDALSQRKDAVGGGVVTCPVCHDASETFCQICSGVGHLTAEEAATWYWIMNGSRAASSNVDAVGGGVPAGMVPWHGGSCAPKDWDGCFAMLRKGILYTPSKTTERWNWSRPYRQHAFDIIAYTPKAASSYDGAAVRERIARIVYDYQVSMGLDSEAAGEDAAGIADAILADLPTSDASERLREHERLARLFWIWGPGRGAECSFDDAPTSLRDRCNHFADAALSNNEVSVHVE